MDSDKIRYFFPKLKKRIALKRNSLWKYCNVERIAMYGYRCFNDATAFKFRLRTMLGAYDASILEGIGGNDRKTILFSAEQALHHEFDLLGSGVVKSNPIDWHTDFKCGKRWNKKYYRELGKLPGAGIKMPWELSRGHFLLWLGEAYLLTGEDKYAQEIINVITWWIDDNPLMYTVNWKCAMDVAFRAVNWMFALNMIAGYNGFNDAFTKKVTKSLWQHGFFIRHNLEKSIPWSNNHYTSDLVGLLYIGGLFSDTCKGRKWLSLAIREFYDETRKQILPSGVHYEKSISYHRLMVELTSYPLSMLKRIGKTIPEDIIHVTQKMYDYVGCYIKPNGKSPLLGDNDDGRFLPFIRRDFREHGYLLDSNGIDQRIINSGITPLFHFHYLNQSMEYQDVGIVIIKKHGTYLLVNNSGYSKHLNPGKKHIGTHTHNDQLSFEFAIGSDDIFIDPGTYLYTSSIKDRNAFRSTRKHNTIVVDDEEQNLLSETIAFLMTINNINREISFNNDECYGSYETVKGQMKHHRRFKVEKGKLEITDSLSKIGKGHHTCLYYHLSDNVSAQKLSGEEIKIESSRWNIVIKWHTENIASNITVDVHTDEFSPSYGVLKPIKRIEAKSIFDEKCTIMTIITWTRK